jgi:hypothetical protein
MTHGKLLLISHRILMVSSRRDGDSERGGGVHEDRKLTLSATVCSAAEGVGKVEWIADG